MKLGFVSAILDGWTFEEMIDTAHDMGYTCVEPGGTFYLFLKSPEPDANAFCKRAQAYDLLFPPADDFACPGWCRIAFCTGTDKVERALPIFEKLAKEYGL